MPDVTLNLALAKSFWTQAILDGAVTAKGVRLNAFAAGPPEQRHEGMRHGEYDAAERGYSGFLQDQALGEGYPQLSLPIWLNRGLRHKNIVTRKGSRIRDLGDLRGGRIGSMHYSATTNIWGRQLLADECRVNLKDVTWVVTGPDPTTPPGLKMEVLGEGRSLSIGALWPMLARDELDGVISPGFNWFYATFRTFAQGMGERGGEGRRDRAESGGGGAAVPPGLQGQIDSLITDPEVCLEYVRRTKIFPLIHSVTIKREIVQEHPRVVDSLVEMFREARRLAPSYMSDEDRQMLEREREGVGFDPYEQRWGESQERTTHTLIRAMVEQGLIPHELESDTFMVPGYREL